MPTKPKKEKNMRFIVVMASSSFTDTHLESAAPTSDEAATEAEKPVAEETIAPPPTAEAPAKSGHARVDSAIDGMVPEPVVDKLSAVTEAAPVAEVGSEAA
jgi:hypothetical protein